MNNATGQPRRTKQRKPSFGNGGVPTPDGFEKYPERRHNGAWKKTDTARYKLEQMLKLTDKELEAVYTDPDAPLFERKLAESIKFGNWKTFDRMMVQVYGMPKQQVETVDKTPRGIELTVLQPIQPVDKLVEKSARPVEKSGAKKKEAK